MNEPFMLAFSETSCAEGNRFASSLAETLRDIGPEIVVDRQREDPDTQDFGASLAIILGTTAVTAVANGIAVWLARNSGAKIELRRKGKLILTATHLDSKDATRIVKAFIDHG